jgi:oligosaccharyltransferase complex subunit alpha (ribophorin I)
LINTQNEEEEIKLKITKESYVSNENFDFYEINFKNEPINFEEERNIYITEDYYERLEMLPKKISLRDDQFAVFKDSINLVSFYQTNEQIVDVALKKANTEVVEYTKKYGTRYKNTIQYLIEEPVKPLEIEPLKIHFEFNKDYAMLNYAHLTFEVSHWGNIAVEEKYQVENIGAKLDGEFGRVDYDDYGYNGGKNALREFRARYPLKAYGLWYRDEIGNVSTSNALREWEGVKLDIEPRFPIMGGWKSNFNLGYNLPTKFHTTTDGKNNYNLTLPFGIPFTDILAKNFTLRLVMPDGASNIRLNLPVEKYHLAREKSFSYLDFFGRPTLVITMNNVYDIHRFDFSVNYTYNSNWLLFKPILVIGFFFFIFICLIVYFRLDLSSSVGEKPKQKTE